MKWIQRWRCHGSIVCCAKVDHPLCGLSTDIHRMGRLALRWRCWRYS